MFGRGAGLFLISFLALFFELLLIRWIPAHVRVIGYFTNFILISAFFGMGMGCLLASSRRNWIVLSAPALAGIFFLTAFLKTMYVDPGAKELFFLELGHGGGLISVHVCLVLFFAGLSLFFFPFGQEIGRSFRALPAARAYAVNLGGSLVGILSSVLLSNAGVSPWILLAAGGILLIAWLFADRPGAFVRAAVAFVALGITAGGMERMDQGAEWSAYHRLSTSPLLFHPATQTLWEKWRAADPKELTELPGEIGFNLSVNDDYFQMALDLSDRSVRERPYLKLWRDAYDQPFLLQKPKRVLIVAGGTGNDAAAALRSGADHVDVVDIEGKILAIGKERHPEKPYSDARVSLFAEDARSFFHSAAGRYDLIVFSYLDSHRLFSQMSNVRLDSFLYTRESFAEARRLLSPGGVLYVHSAVGHTFAGGRIFRMLESIYGRPPVILASALSPAFVGLETPQSVDFRALPVLDHLEMESKGDLIAATDDWPFLYLRERSIPHEYLVAALLLPGLVLLLTGVVLVRKKVRVTPGEGAFFLLGAAFFLLETKSVTDAALLFGSTWFVSALVIGAVLLTLLASTLTVIGLGLERPLLFFPALFGALALLVFLPGRLLLDLPGPARVAAFALLTGLPIFFTSIIFTTLLKKSFRPDVALAFNILGSFAGGCLEYMSMSTGFRMLTLFAAALVAGSYGFLRMEHKGTAGPA